MPQIKNPTPMFQRSRARPATYLAIRPWMGERSDHSNLRSARALGPASRNERHSLILFKRFVTVAMNFAVVREEILATELRHDETKALVIVEPLHDTGFCFQYSS